jgi:hypothetical protein
MSDMCCSENSILSYFSWTKTLQKRLLAKITVGTLALLNQLKNLRSKYVQAATKIPVLK